LNKYGLKYWLIRLPMSFLLIGAFLAYEIYRSLNGTAPRLPTWKLSVYMIAVAACVALFYVGMRERHRRNED
jgi:hypothetical protein